MFKFPIIKSNKTQGDRHIYFDSRSHPKLPSSGEERRPRPGPLPWAPRQSCCLSLEQRCLVQLACGRDGGRLGAWHASQHAQRRGQYRAWRLGRQEGLLALTLCPWVPQYWAGARSPVLWGFLGWNTCASDSLYSQAGPDGIAWASQLLGLAADSCSPQWELDTATVKMVKQP